MKTTKRMKVVGLILALALSMAIVGCGDKNQSGLTIDEPKITVEYLENDYVKQLLRDGAEHVFGNIELSKNEDGSVVLSVDAKQLVEDSTQPNGFYIEDRNYNLTVNLASEARCTFLPGEVSIPQIMNADEFIAAFDKDLSENGGEDADYKKNKLYDMYVMGDQVELILAKYMK